MQHTITVTHRDGRSELLRDHSGVMEFRSREHAERMTHRLAACATDGDRYEVTKPSN